MKRIKTFFTDFGYRWVVIETLRLKFLKLPLISTFVSWYYAGKIFKSKNNGWDRYTEFKELEGDFDKVKFANALYRLESCMPLAEELKKDIFYNAKEDILSTNMINRSDLKDFKKWVCDVEIHETDATMVSEVLNQIIEED